MAPDRNRAGGPAYLRLQAMAWNQPGGILRLLVDRGPVFTCPGNNHREHPGSAGGGQLPEKIYWPAQRNRPNPRRCRFGAHFPSMHNHRSQYWHTYAHADRERSLADLLGDLGDVVDRRPAWGAGGGTGAADMELNFPRPLEQAANSRSGY